MEFKLKSRFKPAGDQPKAIERLIAGLKKGYRDQTLLGVTGSGKTFTMANVIAATKRPALVISHNKTLAAQLASEFQEFFPDNAVHYFVSYYDYYQPEAYMPRTDTYIEKETELNEEIERLRHATTQAIVSRRDVVIVASVSCIYGLGSPTEYGGAAMKIRKGEKVKRHDFLQRLIAMHYERNQLDLWRGAFRVLGDTVEVFPAFSENTLVRVQFFGDEIEKLSEVDSLSGKTLQQVDETSIYPATHYVTPTDNMKEVTAQIRKDLTERVAQFKKLGKPLEAERLEQRTNFDLEMLEATGICKGIENYSRYFDGRNAGTPPYTLMDFFPKDFLLFIDESHMTVPQIRGMYEGDRSRKAVLVDYGFRLPAAMDNRPLKYAEFEGKINQVVYVSATPAEYERFKSQQIVEQVVRPTGLLDPTVEIRKAEHQIDDLVEEIRQRVAKKQRVLVTTLTKRIAEDLTDYLKDIGVKASYLHSDVDTMERLEILHDLRSGMYDVVVGINLLREGLDLPEVSLIAILDADKESFLRSDVALIQTMGRAARHLDGHIIMYADRVSGSMKRAIAETERRRKVQIAFNKAHGITPKSIEKAVKQTRLAGAKHEPEKVLPIDVKRIPKEEVPHLLKDLQDQMDVAAKNLEFEKAARIRDIIAALKGKPKTAAERVRRAARQ